MVIPVLMFFFIALGRFSRTAIPILAIVYGIGFTAPIFLDFPDPVLSASTAEVDAIPSAKEQDRAF